MKAILTATVLLIAGIASAQENNYSDLLKRYKNPGIQKIQPPPGNYNLRRQPFTTPQISIPPAPPAAKLLFELANGNKVYALPQDNMPCVVPNMNQFTIPNGGSGTRIYRYPEQGAIPNPGLNLLKPIAKNTPKHIELAFPPIDNQ